MKNIAPYYVGPGSDLKYCILRLLEDEANIVSKKELKNFEGENFQKLMQQNTAHVAVFRKKIKCERDENGKKKFENAIRVYYPYKNGQKQLTKRNLGISTKIKYLDGNNRHFFLLKPM